MTPAEETNERNACDEWFHEQERGASIQDAWMERARRAEADARDAARYRWLRRRVVMMDYSDDVSIVITAFKKEGPTGEFLDDQIDAAITKEPS